MIRIYVCVAFAMLLPAGAWPQSRAPLTVVPGIDVQRYMGTWYEIARLPNPFQKQCAGEVTATYTLREDGEIDVVNRCRSTNGDVSEAKGRARRADEKEPNAKLEVRFAPAFLSFLPFVWGDYWIINLAPDYSYVVVGEPTRKYLWILARSSSMDATTFQNLCVQIGETGYDLTGLLKTGNQTR